MHHTQNISNELLLIDLNSYLQSSCPVYLKNKSGVYLNCNMQWAVNCNFSSVNDIIGQSDYDLFKNTDEIDIIHKNDNELIQSEKPGVFLETITLQNMNTRSMLIHKIPFKHNDGEAVGILGTSVSVKNSLEQDSKCDYAKNSKLNNKSISKREKECLYYLIRGMSAKEIGKILALSPRTIEFYIENMKKKFSCRNRIDLIAKAYDILENHE